MRRKMAAAILASVMLSVFGAASEAAVLAPEKGYDKLDEPVVVKFLIENDQGKKALAKIGLAATELEGMFKPAVAADVTAAGKAGFEVYSFDGKKLEPKSDAPPVVAADGGVNISAVYPQVKEAGTYVLTWKDATPIVIETLRNPLPWSTIMDETRVRPTDREAYIQKFSSMEPVVTHLVPLQIAVIKTDDGEIKVKFSYDVAPHTVDNFVSLSDQKFYDGTVFHRIIAGFMIQGGDSLGNSDTRAGSGGPGYQIGAEFSDKKHERGVLSMARRDSPDTAGSQFFIVHQKSPHLDGKYTAFADVIDGMKVVDDLASTPAEKGTGAVTGVRPKVESIRIQPATAEMYGIGKK